jgi:hypothetical protein
VLSRGGLSPVFLIKENDYGCFSADIPSAYNIRRACRYSAAASYPQCIERHFSPAGHDTGLYAEGRGT